MPRTAKAKTEPLKGFVRVRIYRRVGGEVRKGDRRFARSPEKLQSALSWVTKAFDLWDRAKKSRKRRGKATRKG